MFSFAPEIRKAIYTTNTIESLNMTLRKIIKNRSLFPSDEAIFKLMSWLYYDADSTGVYVPYQNSEQCKSDEQREREETPEACDICASCGKPIETETLIIQSIMPPPGQEHFHDIENKISSDVH